MSTAKNIITPEFRLSYPQLLTPKRNELNGKDEFSLVALFPKGADMSALKKACEDALAEKFGADYRKIKNLKTPFRDQGEKEKDGVLPAGHVKGAVFMNLRTNIKPGVVDASVQPIIEAGKIYGGCYAKASVRPYAYDQKGNKGVALGLVNVQITRDGEPFGAPRVAAEKEFVAVEGAGTSNEDASDLFGSLR
jgi:hypothetical protein